MCMMTWNKQEITTLGKALRDILYQLMEWYSYGVLGFIKLLHCQLQKLNIQQPQRFVEKYY